jgi:hypothetical protein
LILSTVRVPSCIGKKLWSMPIPGRLPGGGIPGGGGMHGAGGVGGIGASEGTRFQYIT